MIWKLEKVRKQGVSQKRDLFFLVGKSRRDFLPLWYSNFAFPSHFDFLSFFFFVGVSFIFSLVLFFPFFVVGISHFNIWRL